MVHETLISIPFVFPQTEDFDDQFCGTQRNIFHLVSGLARKLILEETRLPAFMSLQRLAEVVGFKQFQAYLSKLTGEQRKIYDEFYFCLLIDKESFSQSLVVHCVKHYFG